MDYLWDEERKHFLLSPRSDRADHIFEALVILSRWLGETEQVTRD